LLLPINIIIEFGSPGFYQYISLLLVLGSYPYFDGFLPAQSFFPFSPDPITILLAIVVCLPGLYFSRWMEQQPREQAVKKMALAAAVFTSLITFPLALFMPYSPFMPIYGGIMMVQSAVPWAIALLVILPIMGRHGSFIDLDRKAGQFSDTPKHMIHEGGIRPGKYTILGYALGIIALCIPNIGSIYSYNIGFSDFNIQLMTPVWTGNYAQYGPEGGSFYLSIMPSITVFMQFLLSIFTIIFAFSILQYLQTHIPRIRVLAYGALSLIAPYGFFTITAPYMTMVPIPVLLALGLPMVFLMKPIPPRQTIWEDKKIKMWFEKDAEDQAVVVPASQPGAKQLMTSKPIDTVKVPFTYLLVSKIRGLRSPTIKSTPESDPSKADWASADPWQSSEEE
ncbi:MAG: hypothetical protein ACW96N_08025, partial [Candidatus Thorarchaeota archaeon]|jgi:hypothetical protein